MVLTKASQSFAVYGRRNEFGICIRPRHARGRIHSSDRKCGLCPPKAGRACAQRAAISLKSGSAAFEITGTSSRSTPSAGDSRAAPHAMCHCAGAPDFYILGASELPLRQGFAAQNAWTRQEARRAHARAELGKSGSCLTGTSSRSTPSAGDSRGARPG